MKKEKDTRNYCNIKNTKVGDHVILHSGWSPDGFVLKLNKKTFTVGFTDREVVTYPIRKLKDFYK